MMLHNGTDTSIAAAEAITPTAATMRARVLEFVQSRGDKGATNDEIMNALSMRIQTVCPRVNELVTGGYLLDTLVRRPTQSGRSAKVWSHTLKEAS